MSNDHEKSKIVGDNNFEKLLNADFSNATAEDISTALRRWREILILHPDMIKDFNAELIPLAEKFDNWDDVRDLFNAVPALFDTEAFSLLDHYGRIAFLKKYPNLYVKFNLSELASKSHMRILSFCEAISIETAEKIDWSVLGNNTISWVMFLNIFPQLKNRCKCFDKFDSIEWMLIHDKTKFQEEYSEFIKKNPDEAL